MRTRSKVWVGVGAFVVVGTGAAATDGSRAAQVSSVGDLRASSFAISTAIPRPPSARILLAQHGDHQPAPAKEGGEGGEAKGISNLPPDLAFGVRLALLRGHLLIGDELVKQQRWNAALPHFLHPTEEIYSDIKAELETLKVSPFEDSLKTLAEVVKAKKGGADYARAYKAVHDALAIADMRMNEKEANWPGFVTEAAMESIKAAAGEYENAIVKGKIVKPVEYQDARGFIWQADRMIEAVADSLQQKDAGALKEVRLGLADLKKAFPAAMPPRKPVKDHAELLAIIARMELAAGKLM
jgi:hypothetical protein